MNNFNTFESRLNYVVDSSRGKCALSGYDIAVVEELAEQHLRTFYDKGYVGITCREALEAPDYLWFYFYKRLFNDKKSYFAAREDLPEYVEPYSPVVDEPDSEWMKKQDFIFLNVRATSLEEKKCGTFIGSLKLLPVLRSKGLHIAPFLDCNFGNVYCIDSMETVSPSVIDKELEAEGFSADAQVRFFIDIAHMANFVTGFDLEPHTSQFSRVVLNHPEHFRWIRLNKKRTATSPSKMVKMMEDSEQKKVQAEVKSIVASALKKAGLKTLEGPDVDYATMKKAHGEIINTLIDMGIWTVPSHTWGGVGLPEFKEYNVKDNYPVFDYRNEKGEDHSGHAFGMLTPYRFYDNLPVNTLPTAKKLPTLREETIDFFAGLFPAVQKNFGFDYVRLDYVDHVFDAVMESHGKLPISDRAIPLVLQRVVDKARETKPYIGAMAERMGTDVIEYGSVGFDVLLGCDILGPVSPEAISGTLMYSKELESFKGQVEAIHSSPDATKESWHYGSHRKLATVPWSIDTHDSGNPLFWTKPISEVIGSSGMLLRQFVARFATAGSVRRPKYECMGNQDMSHGLFKANNEEVSLSWVGDRNHLRLYHGIDDLYNKFSSLIHNGWTTWWEPQENYCVWAIDTHQGDDGFRGRLICVAALERAVKDLKEAAKDSKPMAFVPSISVNVTKDWDRGVKEVTEFLLDGSGIGRRVPVIEGYRIETGSLSPRSYKVFLVRG
jgi:hypothetical protein